MEEELINYFGKIMKEAQTDRSKHTKKITGHILTLVTPDQNDLLMKAMELREVEEVVHQMVGGKSLVPDGFTTNFFDHFFGSH